MWKSDRKLTSLDVHQTGPSDFNLYFQIFNAKGTTQLFVKAFKDEVTTTSFIY
jgi:hypothetical protein